MQSHDFQRRTVLRNTLAVGVSLMVFGCKPKTDDAGTSGAPTNNGSTSGTSTGNPSTSQTSPPTATGKNPPAQSAPTAKMSKAQAQYQDMPKGSQMCANCSQFIATTSMCKVVEGQINPQGWCTVWTAVSPG